MKYFPVLLLFILASCKMDVADDPPADEITYTNFIKVNGLAVANRFRAGLYADSLISLSASFNTENGLHHETDLTGLIARTLTYGLPDSHHPYPYVDANHFLLCCGDAADEVMKYYDIFAPDSNKNFIRLKVNTGTRELWGSFSATFTRDTIIKADTIQFDTLRIECDSFYCKYK